SARSNDITINFRKAQRHHHQPYHATGTFPERHQGMESRSGEHVPALSLSLSEKQRVDTDEGFRLAKTQIVDVGAASLESKGPSHDRHHLAPLRHFSLCGESSDRAWPQGPCLGIGRASRH